MSRLSCENEFCLYQKDGACVLETINLDIRGNCTECIYVNLEEDELLNLKEALLKKL